MDGIVINTDRIVVAVFLKIDQANRVKLLKKSFLMTNISSKVVLGMLFIILSGINIDYLD